MQIASIRNGFSSSESIATDEMKILMKAKAAAVMNLAFGTGVLPAHRC
jgi:hypothetical protein